MSLSTSNSDSFVKRRLPSWMHQGSSGGKPLNPGSVDSKDSRPATRRRVMALEKEVDGSFRGLEMRHRSKQLICKSEKRKIKSDKLDGMESTARQERNGGKPSSSSSSSSSGTTDDDIDLTVDDMLRIAEEYVKADEANWRGSKQVISSSSATRGLSRCTTASTSSVGNESTGVEMPLHTASIVAKSGDAAQDMLDLFLGPLLRKLPETEEFELERANKHAPCRPTTIVDADGRAQDDGEPMTKRKCSLKDKVALFLA